MNNFNEHRNLIRKRAWQISILYELPYEEVEAEAHLIYCKYYPNYNQKKGKFSRYLDKCLLKLHENVKKSVKQKINEINFSNLQTNQIRTQDRYFKSFVRTMEFYDAMEKELSREAKEMFLYMQTYIVRTPRFNSIQKYFLYIKKWSRKKIRKSWNELEKWWIRFKTA